MSKPIPINSSKRHHRRAPSCETSLQEVWRPSSCDGLEIRSDTHWLKRMSQVMTQPINAPPQQRMHQSGRSRTSSSTGHSRTSSSTSSSSVASTSPNSHRRLSSSSSVLSTSPNSHRRLSHPRLSVCIPDRGERTSYSLSSSLSTSPSASPLFGVTRPSSRSRSSSSTAQTKRPSLSSRSIPALEPLSPTLLTPHKHMPAVMTTPPSKSAVASSSARRHSTVSNPCRVAPPAQVQTPPATGGTKLPTLVKTTRRQRRFSDPSHIRLTVSVPTLSTSHLDDDDDDDGHELRLPPGRGASKTERTAWLRQQILHGSPKHPSITSARRKSRATKLAEIAERLPDEFKATFMAQIDAMSDKKPAAHGNNHQSEKRKTMDVSFLAQGYFA